MHPNAREPVDTIHLSRAPRVPRLCKVFYWRERSHEVDFVVRVGQDGHGDRSEERTARDAFPGLAAFGAAFPSARKLLVGGDGIADEQCLERPWGIG